MRCTLPAAVLIFATVAAHAQAPIKTPAYELLVVTTPAAATPAAAETFTALRAAIAAKDAKRLGALLASDFAALSCSADPTEHCAPGRVPAVRAGKTPLDKLRLALCCGGKDDKSVDAKTRDEAMWGLLDSLLTVSGAPGPVAELGDAACLPALPAIDRSKAKELAKALDIEASTFRIAAASIEARGRTDRAAPVAVTLPKGALVPLVTGHGTVAPDGWTALALPAGGVGFAEGVTLDELAPEALCVRQTRDGWRLTYLIGRQN